MPLFLIYLPLIYFNIRKSGLLLHGIVLLLIVMIGKKAGFGSLEFLNYMFNGVVFAYVFSQAFKRKFALFTVFSFCLLSQLVFMAARDSIPMYQHAYRELFTVTTDFLTKKMGITQPVPAYDALQWQVILPVFEIIQNILTTLVLAFLFYRFAGREKPRVSEFTVPDWFIWVLAAGLLFTIYRVLGASGTYVLLSAAAFYAFGGISIVRLFFGRMGPPRLGELLFYAIQPFLLFLPVVSIGIMETWWDFRRRIRNMENDNTIKPT